MESDQEAGTLDRIADLRSRAERMPRAHAMLQLAYAVFMAAYVGVLLGLAAAESGRGGFQGTTMTLVLAPLIISSALIGGANERFKERLRPTQLDLIGSVVFAIMIVGTLAWAFMAGPPPWWIPLAAALVTFAAFGHRPLGLMLRSSATSASDPTDDRSKWLSLPVRLTTAFLGVFFGLTCAVVFVPALGWLVMLFGMVIVLIAMSVRSLPWGFLNVGYEWRLPQWIAFGIASTIMFALALLIAATHVVTPGIAAGAGALVAASLIVSALLPGRSRGASAA
jgi:hypothetical protein